MNWACISLAVALFAQALVWWSLFFEFVEDLLDVPAHPVEQGDDAGPQGDLVCEELVGLAAVGIGVGDAAQHDSVGGGADLFVALHPAVGRIGAIPAEVAAADDREVLLGAADEVDVVSVFEVVSEPEVDPRRIPDEDGLLPDGDPFADTGRAGALHGAHVVLLAAVDLVAKGEMAQRVAAQVEQVEVADGVVGLLALVGAFERVVAGMFDPVSVAGEDFEVGEVADAVEGIGQQGARVLEESRGGVAAKAQAALAFEGLEEVLAGRDLAAQAEGLLEKGASAGMVAENAGDAEFQPAPVGDRGTMPAVRGGFKKREKRLEELFGNRWNAMGCIGHENFWAKG